MTYTVRIVNDWNKPYDWLAGDRRIVRERQIDETVTPYADIAIGTVKDRLDIPDKPMLDEDVRREFESENRPLEQKFVNAIRDYYNGRLKIFERFNADFKRENESGRKLWILKYDIPYEINHFETETDDGWAEAMTQNEAYIEI